VNPTMSAGRRVLQKRTASQFVLATALASFNFWVGLSLSTSAWASASGSEPASRDATRVSLASAALKEHAPITSGDDDDDDDDDGDASAIRVPAPVIEWRGHAAWQIGRQSSAKATTEAYSDRASYLPGDNFGLAVSTSAPTYQVTIWRMGVWPTLVTRSPLLSGRLQKPASVDLDSGLTWAGWAVTYRWVIPAGTQSGLYLARVHGASGADAYASFVVRSTRRSQLLFVANSLTDAAYNTWGGASFYRADLQGFRLPVPHAVQVSLDRPNVFQDGAGSMFELNWPLARWLERTGYDVTYTTDLDLSLDPSSTPLPAAVVFGGHTEYWTNAMRDWLDKQVVRRADVGLAIFGANSGYWRVELSADGRTVTCYKETALLSGSRNASEIANGGRAQFRDKHAVNGGGDRPEQLLFGVQYGSIPALDHEYRLGGGVPAELLVGTGLGPGSSLGRIAGGETDFVNPGVEIPAGLRTIATSDFLDIHASPGHAAAAFRGLPSGKAVFAAGSFRWMWGLDSGFAASHGVPASLARLTTNILARVTGQSAQSPLDKLQ
jgi:hypothetical protein